MVKNLKEHFKMHFRKGAYIEKGRLKQQQEKPVKNDTANLTEALRWEAKSTASY